MTKKYFLVLFFSFSFSVPVFALSDCSTGQTFDIFQQACVDEKPSDEGRFGIISENAVPSPSPNQGTAGIGKMINHSDTAKSANKLGASAPDLDENNNASNPSSNNFSGAAAPRMGGSISGNRAGGTAAAASRSESSPSP